MDKKDIYEHLANIYLDASSKKKNKAKERQGFKTIFFFSITIVFSLGALLIANLHKNKPANTEIALVLVPEAVKINFHFDPAKKEVYYINLKKLDLTKFKKIDFSVKKTYYQDDLALRVEFTNTFREKSEVYVKVIPHKWHNYEIALFQFTKISDWSEMIGLSFTVEEWNVGEKKGLVYIDNIRLLR